VDYIYTDPPYGSKIPYLDLSIMWNEWLELPVDDEDYANEAIEGGEMMPASLLELSGGNIVS
jgi:adenine-specific DNA methylase